MEFFKKTALAALVMGFSGAALALPNITILATGGTIAGGGDSATKSNYTAGKVGVENLVNAVPQLKDIANVKGEQVVNIGSQDMNDNVWLTLAKKINTDCDKTDGFVINYANASDLPAKALVDAGYDGIVSAGVGNGNLYKSVFDTLATAAKNGTVVVRSSRVPTGATTQDAEVDDAKYGFVASGTLNPQKARVLLQLALTQTKDPQQIQQIFNQY
ncbi:asparaginase domain-containing protein [Escherichia coli]|uniref:asparaginase domain-containing protein n=1 Tax=Escherichia coli TaxID=562 RepID=UPI00233FCA15|nr:asparaginase domain-containing protein [Escherichia coli]MDC3558332.1 asparaginase [Escherichia coli]